MALPVVGWMNPNSLARKAWRELEAILDKLLVFRERGAFQDAVAAIHGIVEQRMSDVLRMDADLVGASGFQAVFVQGDVAETFQYLPVGHRFFAVVAIGIDGHLAAVVGASPYMSCDGTFFAVEIAPNQGLVAAVYRVVEELSR